MPVARNRAPRSLCPCSTMLHLRPCTGGGLVLAGYWFHTESSFDSRWGAKLYTRKEFLDVNQQAGWNLTFTPLAALPTAPLVTFNASERWHPTLLVGVAAACRAALHAAHGSLVAGAEVKHSSFASSMCRLWGVVCCLI